MSKETKPKRARSTKSNKADLEAKIAELEARLANLSDQVQPSTAKPAPKPAPKAEAKPAPRPAASGSTHGTLPAGMKPAPKPAPQPEPAATYAAPEVGEVAPAYATISSSGYTGNRYFATRKRMSYHPADKQFTGSSATTTAPPPEPPPLAREPERQVSQSRDTLPAGAREPEKKSMWRSKGAEYENYAPQETKKSPPPQHEHAAPPPPPKPAPRPAASGSTHGTLPAGMKPAPKPAPQPEPAATYAAPEVGEVAPAYATISSSGYTGNRYFATRKRMSYHPADKQFTGSSATTTAPPPEPPKPKTIRGTLPAGFKA